MTDQVFITTEHKAEPNLRKLARALIALAELRLATEHRGDDRPSSEAVIPDTGDAA